MEIKEQTTEQFILDAAEAEFLEKGYASAKMMEIAKRADVAHSMLHYYFRSKKKLFQTIFIQKTQTLQPLFESVFDKGLPFQATIRLLMETQFDFLSRNPKLPFFLLTEAMTNMENRELLVEVLSKTASKTFAKLKLLLEQEIEKGNARPIAIQDLLMNFISINISTFFVLPIAQDNTTENLEKYLKERRESNVQFVLAALRP